jgi:cullin 3
MYKKGKPICIKAPRPTTIETGTEFIAKLWKLLHTAIQEIYNNNASDLSYEELYRSAYNMVLHRHGETLYDNVQECMIQRLEFITKRVLDAINDDPSQLLKIITNEWESYRTATRMIGDILMYLDRSTVVNNEEKFKPVYINGINLFREHVLDKTRIGEQTKQQVIQTIQRERNGEIIDRLLLKSTVHMLNDLRCYVRLVEEPLQVVTAKHYSQLSQNLLQQASIPEYLKRIDERLREEVLRVQYYLVQETKKKLETILLEEMISRHLDIIIESPTSGFFIMLNDDKIEDLRRMFELFTMTFIHMEEMIRKFRKHVSKIGLDYVQDDQRLKNPIQFIQGILDMKQKFDKIVLKSFENSKRFKSALEDGFREFCDGIVQKRMAEYLSLYVDSVLRKSTQQEEDQVDSILEHVMEIFRFLKDKDVFENYYKIHLSKRLLTSRSYHLLESQSSMERLFVTKLKLECGFYFTSKIEGMFNDMRLSRTSMDQYRNHKAFALKDEKIDLYVNVLTSSFWPTYNIQSSVLPLIMEQCCKSFVEYYNDVHSGRKITWQKNLGDGILVANYPTGMRHELLVTTYQMIILLLFNDMETMSFEEIQQRTQINERELRRQLLTLCTSKYRIIIRTEFNNGVSSGDISSNNTLPSQDRFTWNAEFHNSNVRIRIGTAPVKETIEEVKQTESKIEMDRKPIIEAAIVRIMKSRKVLHHNQLIEEIVKQLQSRFAPSPQEIKKRIESLIEREFLERQPTDRKMYHYLA